MKISLNSSRSIFLFFVLLFVNWLAIYAFSHLQSVEGGVWVCFLSGAGWVFPAFFLNGISLGVLTKYFLSFLVVVLMFLILLKVSRNLFFAFVLYFFVSGFMFLAYYFFSPWY